MRIMGIDTGYAIVRVGLVDYDNVRFSLVEYGRRRGIKANSALAVANTKFLDRFEKMENLARERGLELDRLSLAEMDALWDEIKPASPK